MRSKNSSYFGMIEDCINSYYEKNARPPQGLEIASALGLSRPTVTRYLAEMAEQGIIEYDERRRPVTRLCGEKKLGGSFVPVVGRIPCGGPAFAQEDIEGYVRLPEELTGKGEFFLLRASGDSMIEAGIASGDLVLIRKQNFADPGKIIAALVENENATLKRYYPEPEHGRIRLHPENSEMEDMYFSECTVMGVAVKVIKDLE